MKKMAFLDSIVFVFVNRKIKIRLVSKKNEREFIIGFWTFRVWHKLLELDAFYDSI